MHNFLNEILLLTCHTTCKGYSYRNICSYVVQNKSVRDDSCNKCKKKFETFSISRDCNKCTETSSRDETRTEYMHFNHYFSCTIYPDKVGIIECMHTVCVSSQLLFQSFLQSLLAKIEKFKFFLGSGSSDSHVC